MTSPGDDDRDPELVAQGYYPLLWGREPLPAVKCPGCNRRAEPFRGWFCWKCVHSGQMARLLKVSQTRDVTRWLTDPWPNAGEEVA